MGNPDAIDWNVLAAEHGDDDGWSGFADAWGQVFDDQRFQQFLADLFDAAVEEYGEVLSGSVRVMERSPYSLKIDLTAAALV